MGANKNGDDFSKMVLLGADTANGPSVTAAMIARLKEQTPVLLEHRPPNPLFIDYVQMLRPEHEIEFTPEEAQDLTALHNIHIDDALVAPQRNEEIMRAWLTSVQGPKTIEADLKLLDSTFCLKMLEKFLGKIGHPAFAYLKGGDDPVHLPEEGSQDEIKESIHELLEAATNRHIQVIFHGLASYDITVTSHRVEYSPPKIFIEAKTARPVEQVNGIMTNAPVRKMMTGQVWVRLSSQRPFEKPWSKQYKYDNGMMRHKSDGSTRGIEYFEGDVTEDDWRIDSPPMRERGFDSVQIAYQITGTVSGRTRVMSNNVVLNHV